MAPEFKGLVTLLFWEPVHNIGKLAQVISLYKTRFRLKGAPLVNSVGYAASILFATSVEALAIGSFELRTQYDSAHGQVA